MNAPRWFVSGLLLALGFVTHAWLAQGTGAVPEVPAAENLPKHAKARLDAAHKTYDLLWQNNKEGVRLSTELVYRWSSRWLDAERDLCTKKEEHLTALAAHLDRMKDLERMTVERFRTRVTTIDEVQAAAFFRAEAEVWLTKATMAER